MSPLMHAIMMQRLGIGPNMGGGGNTVMGIHPPGQGAPANPIMSATPPQQPSLGSFNLMQRMGLTP